MRTSDSRSDERAQEREDRNARIRVYLAVYWVAWVLWLVFRPRNDTTIVTPDAKVQLAIFGFAIVFLVVFGLLHEWRWPVTATRALLAATAIGTIVGPAGRPLVIYLVDLGFLLAGAIPAYFLLQMGTAPLERSSRLARGRAARLERYQQRRFGKRP